MTATLTARLLPSSEWSALAGTELDHLSHLSPPPEGVLVVVVEQDAQIVACWAAVQTIHVEGLWKREDFRGDLAAGRLLLTTMLDLLRANDVSEVLTSAISSEVEVMLTRIGGSPIPGRLWHFPVPPAPT